ncbi:MAG: InlB B-repeat-containing protein [Alphaproteobacteria bacterium]|nr:InlB B-repeat-containing protein [Alphaproteobacteria bacterium]
MKNILKFRFLSRFVMLFLFIFGLNTALSTPALAATMTVNYTSPTYTDVTPNKTVSLVFNGNKIGCNPSAGTCSDGESNIFTRPGYHISGWKVTNDGCETKVLQDFTVLGPLESLPGIENACVYGNFTMVLEAVWETANTYTVRFNSNNGTGTTKTQSFSYDGVARALTANTFSYAGHTFLGWSRDKDATTPTYTDRQSVKNLATSGEVTLYAVWEPISLKISYSTTQTGGTGQHPTSPVSCTSYDTCTLPANPYTKTGYTFAGWGCAGIADCDNDPTMDAGSSLWDKISVSSWGQGDTITLFPKWTANCNVIKIMGSKRGGSGMYPIYKKTGSSKVYKTSACSDSAVWTSIPDELISTVKKDNAMFAGTTNDCIKAEKNSVDRITLSFNTAKTDCNVTSTQEWYARFYCDQYWLGSGQDIEDTCTGSTVQFIYKTEKNGTEIDRQQCVYGSPCAAQEIKGLYNGIVGKVANDYNYECVETQVAAGICEELATIEQYADLTPVMQRYISDHYAEIYYRDADEVDIALSMNLYPNWVAVTNKLVVYESASATSAFSTNDCPYGATASVCIPESKRPTKAGYTLIGYCQGKNDSCSNVIGIDSANLSTLATGSTTINLTAQWQLNTYEITLDSGYYTSSTAGGGLPVATVAAPTKIYEKYGAGWYTNSAATTAFTQLTTLPKYNKAVFGGFYTGKAGTGTQVIDASGNVSSNKTIYSTPNATTGTAYAKYTACACVNGSNVSECTVSGTNDNNQCVYNVTCVAGYINASNVGAVGVASNTMNCGDLVKYLLKFNGNGNDGGSVPTATSATYGLKLPSIDKTAIPTKTGYVFDGWYDTNASTGGNQYYTENNIGVSGKSFDKTSNTTLYARWTPDTYTINLNHNGGTSSVSSVSVTFNQQIPATVTKPSRVGYTFDGYYTSATDGTQYYDQNGNRKYTTTWAIAAGTTIYAHWTAIEYQCAASYYLPAGATKCELCKDGHYCTGGTYKFNETQDQGIGECPIGTYTVATSNVRFECTACSKGLINSSPTDTGCEACPNTNNGVESWEQTDWDASTGVTNLCTIRACKDGYTGSGSGANTKCTANQYTVTLNVNGGTGGMDSVTATYDSAMPKLTSVPTRDHYTLAGYYDTMAKSGGNKYYNADGTSAKAWDKTTDMMLFARWIPDVYTITLDSFPTAAGILKVNPVEASPNKLYVKYEDGIYTEEKCINPVTKITPPTNDATAFKGFYTTATGTGNEIITADGNFKIDLTRITSGVTLFARWTTRVTPCAAGKYLPKGANTCASCLPGYYCEGGNYAYNTTTNQGLTGVCAGGYSTGGATESACTACNTGYVATGTSAENHDAADDCKPITYHLKYSCGTGSGDAPAQVTAKYDTSYTVAANSCEKTGHTFLGWLCTGGTSCNSTPVNAGVSVKNLTATNNATVTMTAQWGLNAYKICFDSRGGSVTPECVDVEYGGALPTINLENMQMTGGTFLGFFDPNDLTKKYYNTTGFPAIEAYDIDSDITLVAGWKVSTIKCNAGYYLPQNDATCKKCEAGYACPGGTFTYTGEMQGRTKCATDKYSEAGANICLICPRICDANFNCKDAVLVDVNKNGLNDSAHECYIQTNYTDASSTGTQYCYYTSGSTPSPVYDTNCAEKQIASCNAGYELQNGTCVLKRYTISYELNGGTNSDSNPTSYTVVSPTKVLQSPKRQGYTFVNWYTDSGSSVSQITNGTIGNIKLYAEWEPTSIKINYQCNGTTTKTQTCTVESTSCELDPDVCEKSGFYYDDYVFDAVGSDIISSNFLKTDDLVTNSFVAELLAKPGDFWNQGAVINLVPDYKDLYTVPMQFNAACTKLTGQMPTNMTDCTNLSCVLPDANISCEGYKKWDKVWLINNALTFNDMPFAVGTDIKDIVQEHNQELINSPVLIIPNWQGIDYTVSYKSNKPKNSIEEVSGTVESTDHTYNTKKKVQQNTYSLRGYTSNGWNTEPDGSGTPIASGEEVENLTSIDGDNVPLYAQYTANTYTVKYYANGGSGTMNDQPRSYNDGLMLSDNNFIREGYSFAGWNTEPDGSGTDYSTTSVGNLTDENGVTLKMYAQWTQNVFSVDIEYNCGDGSGSAPALQTCLSTDDKCLLAQTSCKKDGYIFMGWMFDGGLKNAGDNVLSYAISENDDKTFDATAVYTKSEFEIKTTPTTQTFNFTLAATGTFYVDWGDGKTQVIEKTDTLTQSYVHEYETVNTYDIKFAGQATLYNAGNVNASSISFENNMNISSISGSLGAIFGPLSNPENGEELPRFRNTFYGCANLTSEIPADLFSGISGQPSRRMFQNTFSGTKISGSIPEGLFAGIAGNVTDYLFYRTFQNCSKLTGQIPADLFAGITGELTSTTTTQLAFSGTFWNAGVGADEQGNPLTIPNGLFSGLSTTNYISGQMANIFTGTKFATACPGGGYKVTAPENPFVADWSEKAMCNTCPSDTSRKVTTDAGNNNGINSCYAVCPTSITITNGTTTAVNTKENYDGTKYPACTYNAVCDTGYDAKNNGSTKPSCAAHTYKVIYVEDTANVSVDAVFGQPFTFSRPTPVKTGYTGTGWQDVTGKIYEINEQIIYNKARDMSVTPAYKANEYNAIYDCGNGTDNVTEKVAYDDDYTLKTDVCTQPGRTFVGWSVDGVNVSNAFVWKYTHDVTFTARYSNNAYECEPGYYLPQGGTICNAECETGSYCPGGVFEYTGEEQGMNPCPQYSDSVSGASACTCYTGFTVDGIVGGNNMTTEHACMLAPQFVVTTTAKTTSFRFNIAAKGKFWVDCGDGSAVKEIDRTKIDFDTDYISDANTAYTCKYSKPGMYEIRFAGRASGYDKTHRQEPTYSAIRFSEYYANDTYNEGLETIHSISGSLGAIFPTLKDGANPTFYGTFAGQTAMTGEIPSTLFDGIHGKPVEYMFEQTFANCIGLTGDIPATLFAGLDGAAAKFTFYQTFYQCAGLTGIPSDLFKGVKGDPAYGMFSNTFRGCSGLTGSIPEDLFANVYGAPAERMFVETFTGCSGLTGPIPAGLFRGITGDAAPYMFFKTFDGCTGLTGNIPHDLFRGITGAPKISMFRGIFHNCSGLTGSIPSDLFAGIKGEAATTMFVDTFYGCSGIDGYVPTGLFANITNNSGLTGTIKNIFLGTSIATQCPTDQYKVVSEFSNQWGDYVACNTCPGVGTIESDGQYGIEMCHTTIPCNENGAGTKDCKYNAITSQYDVGCTECEYSACVDGYYLNNGICEICPVGSYCANSIKNVCPDTYTTESTGAVLDTECFANCADKEVIYGTGYIDKPLVFLPEVCTHTYGISVTGNPCKIIDNVCVETSCNYDYEMINGKCELCVRDNALTFKSGAGNCIVESCLYGYHPFDQSCVPNTRECSIDGALSAEQKWDTKTNNFGPCMVTECAEGYHIDANTCVLDVQTCELENGMGEKVYNHDLKKWGDCVVTTCKPGYTNDPSQTNETWKQCGQCNNMFGANGERAVSSYLTECEIASCMYQGEKYILENNECVLICDERSDETGSRHWNGNKCVHECKPGFLTW